MYENSQSKPFNRIDAFHVTQHTSSGAYKALQLYFIQLMKPTINKNKQTNGISIELDRAGENSIDSDDNALGTGFSH